MSSAMALHHRRQGMPRSSGIRRVTARCANCCGNWTRQHRERLEQLLEAALDNQGDDVSFLNKWGYDAEQRQAISSACTPSPTRKPGSTGVSEFNVWLQVISVPTTAAVAHNDQAQDEDEQVDVSQIHAQRARQILIIPVGAGRRVKVDEGGSDDSTVPKPAIISSKLVHGTSQGKDSPMN